MHRHLQGVLQFVPKSAVVSEHKRQSGVGGIIEVGPTDVDVLLRIQVRVVALEERVDH